MELLLGLIAEFALAAAVAVFTFLAEMVVALISLIADLIYGRPRRKRHARSQSGGSGPLVSRILLATTVVSGFLLGLGVIAILVINFVFFQPTAAWVAGKISQKTKIDISFEEASGNLLTGELSLKDIKVERRQSDKTEYALAVRSVHADVDVLSLVFGTTNFSVLAVDGINGDIWSKPKPAGDRKDTELLKPKKSFGIERLSLTDADIRLNRPGAAPIALAIDTMVSEPFRSQFAVFDVFFRSNVTASIEGHPVLISTSDTGDGRRTQWSLKEFSASSVRHFVDKPPFNWFEQGTIDVSVDDRWQSLDAAEIDMDWQIVLKDVKVVSPEGSGLVNRALAKPVASYINNRDKDINLRFRTVLNKEQFLYKPSLDATGIWSAVLEGTARAIADKSDATTGEVKGKINNSLDRLKNFLDKKRKKNSDNEQQ